VELYLLIERIKLWISRNGTLHGIKSLQKNGEIMQITTHCNKSFVVRDSRNSRAARYMRQKFYSQVCPKCGIPEWKLEKFSATRFNRHHGSNLKHPRKTD
jgi:pyrrolysyl-tRNA synthetase-like protein